MKGNQPVAERGGFWQTRGVGLALVLGLAVLLGLLYLPALVWLGRVTAHTAQLTTGGVLVLLTVVICLRDTLGKLPVEPQLSNLGMGLLFLAFFCLWLVGHVGFPELPAVVFSFCLACAAIIAFLFGTPGVRQFMPALGGFLVFGLLVGLIPELDWPLRAIAARQAAGTLAWLGLPVHIGLVGGRPAELLLEIQGRIFVVATECNGFGLLTSSLLLATILAFHFRLPWINKLGLVVFSMPVAIICNYLRIVSICVVAPRTKMSYTWVHEGLGTVFYYIGLGLIWMVASRHMPKRPPKSAPPAPSSGIS